MRDRNVVREDAHPQFIAPIAASELRFDPNRQEQERGGIIKLRDEIAGIRDEPSNGVDRILPRPVLDSTR
jgi:hypothetical protein